MEGGAGTEAGGTAWLGVLGAQCSGQVAGGCRVGPAGAVQSGRRWLLNYSPARGVCQCDLGRNQTPRGRRPVTQAGSCDLPFNYSSPGRGLVGKCG